MKIEISATTNIDDALSISKIVVIEQIKIGQFAKSIFHILLKIRILTTDELKNLQDKDYCKRVFKLSSLPCIAQTTRPALL